MTEKFYIGSENTEIFLLWLRSKITFFSNHANCYFIDVANSYKQALSGVDEFGVNCKYVVFYAVFVSDLCKNI